jgi:hypothetical protein
VNLPKKYIVFGNAGDAEIVHFFLGMTVLFGLPTVCDGCLTA